MTAELTARRLLTSSLVDLLVGPHGIDRYLELIRPDLTVRDARARVVAVHRQTSRSVTLTVRPNAAWRGFRAGQFARIGVDIDGVRRTRTYSPSGSQHRSDGLLELTVTTHPEGVVSRHLRDHGRPGQILHLGAAQGDFALPQQRPQRLVLISGGSGVTPVVSMLRTLCDEGHEGEVAFIHYTRTSDDWLYQREVQALAASRPNLTLSYAATREGDRHFDQGTVEAAIGDFDPFGTTAAVCGPPSLIDAVRELWHQAPERVLAETFTAPTLKRSGARTEGTLNFVRSDIAAPIAEGTLLEQAEAAGLTPDFGCRMGICHTCTCRKTAGAVRDIRTGEVSIEEDVDIQLCVSVPAGDVALEL